MKVGDRVIRVSDPIGFWGEKCRSRGLPYHGEYTIQSVGSASLTLEEFGTSVFMESGFVVVASKEIKMEDFL